MADFTYRGTLDGSEPNQREFAVASGTTSSIAIGDPVTIANGYAAKVSDGGGTSGQLNGLAVSTSTETAGADGTVEVLFSEAGLIVQGTATTPGNLVTAVLFDKVTFDVSGGGDVTVDENDAGGGQILIYELDSDSATTGICRVVIPFALFDS